MTKDKLITIISYAGDRIKEPSTAVSISALVGLCGHNVDPGITQNVLYTVAGLTGIAGIILKEGDK